MPPRRRCSLTHIRDILSGHKKYFHIFEIKSISVPRIQEFAVNNIYDMVKGNEKVMQYIPWFNANKYEAKNMFHRQWLFDLINTIDDKFFLNLMDELDAARLEACRVQEPEKHQVTVIKELVDLIEAGIGCQEGNRSRYIGGLKLGSKRLRKNKKRPNYEVRAIIRPDVKPSLFPGNFLARYRIGEDQSRKRVKLN